MRTNIQDEGDEDYAASTTGFVEGIRSEPALHQHDGDHGSHEGMLMYGKVSQENYVELTAASAIPNKEIKSPQILRY